MPPKRIGTMRFRRIKFYTVFNYNNFSYDEDNDFKNENPQNGNIVSEDNQSIDHTKHNYFWGFGYGQEIDGWDFKLGYIGRARNEDYLTAAFDKVDGSFELSPANRIITISNVI